jgi:hypothetical protein
MALCAVGTGICRVRERTCAGPMRRVGLIVAILAFLCSLCCAGQLQHTLDASALASQQQSNQAGEQSKGQSGEHELPAWVRVVLEFVKVFSWPILAALALMYFAFSKFLPYKLAKVLKPFRSLKLFGAEFVLSDEVGADAEEAIVIYRKRVKRRFDMLGENYGVRTKLESVIDSLREAFPQLKNAKGIRWTIHVPDVLFADTLYQLVDYYPRGGGRARAFSFRFGVIGLCWRKKQRVVEGKVPTYPDKRLLEEWGMSEEEARASGSGKQSFFAVPLRDKSKTPVGIFYMDSNDEYAFAADKDEKAAGAIEIAIIKACEDQGLTTSLSKINDDFKDKRPAIRVHEQ